MGMDFERFWSMRFCDFLRRVEGMNRSYDRRNKPKKKDKDMQDAAKTAAEIIEQDKKRKPVSLRDL